MEQVLHHGSAFPVAFPKHRASMIHAVTFDQDQRAGFLRPKDPYLHRLCVAQLVSEISQGQQGFGVWGLSPCSQI